MIIENLFQKLDSEIASPKQENAKNIIIHLIRKAHNLLNGHSWINKILSEKILYLFELLEVFIIFCLKKLFS